MKQTYNWIWKWHFIGGMVILPFVLLLSITGMIYLFKDGFEEEMYTTYKSYEPIGEKITYEVQLQKAKEAWGKAPEALVLPDNPIESTHFIKGRFSHKSHIFVNPTTGEITGKINTPETDMHKVRKLHGELLLGSFGTKIVELVASWMVVLLITGIYLFWPRDRGIKGLFTIRTGIGKRLFYRDLHGVIGFWFSGLLLLILAGGMPWTDVFGSGYKWVQSETQSGFPPTWFGMGINSEISGESPLSYEEIVQKVQALQLDGEVSVKFPRGPKGTFNATNQTVNLEEMKSIHFDQYTGEKIYENSWCDIGFMMKTRLWVMAFHQGKFGTWNLIIVLITAFALILLAIAAMISYLKRKPKGDLGIPKSEGKPIGLGLIVILGLFSVLLPVFGLSVILILVFQKLLKH